MTWLTWRQFRAQMIVATAALALLLGVLAATGPNLARLYREYVASCHGAGACQAATLAFANQVQATTIDKALFTFCVVVMYAAPALIGVFWGAPLIAREIDAGTFRLAWSQSVSRRRWLAVKLGLVALAAMATVGLLSVMVGWWSSPIYATALKSTTNPLDISKLGPAMFGANGIVPVGYAAFAFTLGVTAGVLIRRTVPAMAATLGGFALVQVGWANWIRPHLIAPLRQALPFNFADPQMVWFGPGRQMSLGGGFSKPGAWILSDQTITRTGHVFTGPAPRRCLTGGMQVCERWLASLHLRTAISYQPASRFWAFQWYETVIFLALAMALAGFCYRRVRRLAP
jgi:hypothetical protein